MTTTLLPLDADQRKIEDALLAGVRKGEPVQTLGGYAGTGKSFLISHLRQKTRNFAVAAYTGKAADVLRRKGVEEASTIHSLIYQAERDDWGHIHFHLRDYLPFDGIIIDEASMVGEEQHEDLLSFGIPLIYVGDHGQLPPVKGKLNLMQEPQYRLEKLRRNAGEIAHFAQHLRTGKPAKAFPAEKRVAFLEKGQVTPDNLCKVDQVICAYNKTRVSLNQMMRKHLGRVNTVEVGDRVVCRRNNREAGLFNGMQGTVLKVRKGDRRNRPSLDLDVYGERFKEIDYDPGYFNTEKRPSDWNSGDPNWFDYAYTITCHGAQGDEYDSGLVVAQPPFRDSWPQPCWDYTAASRFRKWLYWHVGGL